MLVSGLGLGTRLELASDEKADKNESLILYHLGMHPDNLCHFFSSVVCSLKKNKIRLW